MKKLLVAACAMFMFGAVTQAQTFTKTDAKQAETVDATATKVTTANADADASQAAAEEAANKKAPVVNNPYTEKRKAEVKAEKALQAKKAAKTKKVKAKIDN